MNQVANEMDVQCPYCGNSASFITSKEFYGKDYGSNLYVCTPCDARVGTHGKGKTALGTMANANLRELRKRCHSRIDPIWKTRKMSRGSVYNRLQKVMSLSSSEAHIGLFDEQKCNQLLQIFERGEFLK